MNINRLFKILTILLLFGGINISLAQRISVSDHKGTKSTIGVLVTEAANAPANPIEGDIWIDTNAGVTKVYSMASTAWLTFQQNTSIPFWKPNSDGGVYAVNAIVNDSGLLYKNLTGTNTDTSPDTDATNWEVNFVDTYATGVPIWKTNTNGGSYSVNDIVNHDGVLFKNTTGANVDTSPDGDTTNWSTLSMDEEAAIDYKNTAYNNTDVVGYAGKIYTAKQAIHAPEFDSYSGTKAYANGDQIFHNSVIKEANQSITYSGTVGDYPYNALTIAPYSSLGFENRVFRVDPASAYGTPPTGNFGKFKIKLSTSVANLAVKLFDNTGSLLSDVNASLEQDIGDSWYSYVLDSPYALTGNESIGFYVPVGISVHNDYNAGSGYTVYYNSVLGNQSTTDTILTDRIFAFELLADATTSNAFDASKWDTVNTLPATNWRIFREGAMAVPVWYSNASGGVYSSNDLVNYNGVLFKNRTGTNANITPDIDNTNWEQNFIDTISTAVPLWESNVSGAAYAINDLVNYDGVLYKNRTSVNKNIAPPADATNWETAFVDSYATTIPLWESSANGGIYSANDIINYNGILFKSRTGVNTDFTPDMDPTNWEVNLVDTFTTVLPLWESNSNGGSYIANDVINYNGILYKNLTGTNTDTTPDADATNWEVNVVDTFVTTVPLWDSNMDGGAYAINDIINHGGLLYKNLTGVNTDTTPDLDASNWERPNVDATQIGAKEYDSTQNYVLGQLISRPDGLYSNSTPITTPEAFDSTKWKKVATAINTAVLAIADAAVAPPTAESGDRYILINTATSEAGWGTIAGLEDHDIVSYDGTNWTIVLDVSVPVNTGSYQAYNEEDTTLYYFNGNQWTGFGSGGGDTVPLWKSDANGGVYVTNDIINHNGILYKNLTGTNLNTNPSEDVVNWELAASGGDGASINDGAVSTSSTWSSSKIAAEIVASGNLIDNEGLLRKELVSTLVSSGQVTLSFPQIEAAVYHIFYDTQPIYDLTGSGNMTTTQQTATITGLTNGTPYYFYVKPVVAPSTARVLVRPGTALQFSSVITADGIAGDTGTLAVEVTADGSANGYKFILTTDGVTNEVIQTGTSYTFTNIPRFENDIAITSVTRTSQLAAYAVTGHGLIAGQSIYLDGFTDTSFNGNMIVESTTANTFSVFQKGEANTTSTGGVLKVYKNHSLVVESLDDVTAQNTLITSSTISLNVSEKYFVKNSGGYWGYNKIIYDNSFGLYAPRSLSHYDDPTAYNDWIEPNTKFAKVVGLRRLPYVLVAPTSVLSRTVPVYAVFDDSEGVYGSAYYMQNAEMTNTLVIGTTGSGELNIDDSDSIFEDGRGEVLIHTTNQAPHPKTTGTIFRVLRSSTSTTYSNGFVPLMGAQPTLTTSSERVGQAVFEATNRVDNRNIIVWADLVNQRFAFRAPLGYYYISFSSLGINLQNTSTRNDLAMVSDGIDTLLVGQNGRTFYTIQFNWVNGTATLKKTHPTYTADVFFGNGTEEDTGGVTLHFVNGKVFYVDTANTTMDFALAGSPYDATDSGKVTHHYNNLGSTNQIGTDTLHGVSQFFYTSPDGVRGYQAIFVDKGHDGPGAYVGGGIDSTVTWARATNLIMIALGSGVY